jgi:protein required for attachment to host cells
MSKIGLTTNIWVLVCDGHKALILQNAGDRVYPKLEARERFEHEEHQSRDLGSDAPGRSHSSGSDRRSSVDQIDLHRLEDDKFLKGVAAHLDRAVTAGQIEKLILVAPAHAMGLLRKALSPAAHKAIAAEVEGDYVHLPLYEIEKHLTKHFAEQ